MENLNIGVHILAANAKGLVDRIVEAEEAGIDTAWMTVGGVAADPFAVFAVAAQRTSRIEFGTSIVPTFPRHPLAMAQGAATVDSFAPGRLKLGVGPSHKPAIEGTWGLNFDRPLEHLREYVTILNSILKDGKVDFHGKRLTAVAQIAAPTQVRVMISALRHNAFKLAGEISEGGISWVMPLPSIKTIADPAIREGATAAGRAKPPVVVHVPVVVSEDSAAVVAAGSKQFGFYPRLPFYSSMWQDAGCDEAAKGEFSERMAQALIISGDAETVATRIRDIPNSGGNEIICSIVNMDDGGEAAKRTLRLLGQLAQGK